MHVEPIALKVYKCYAQEEESNFEAIDCDKFHGVIWHSSYAIQTNMFWTLKLMGSIAWVLHHSDVVFETTPVLLFDV